MKKRGKKNQHKQSKNKLVRINSEEAQEKQLLSYLEEHPKDYNIRYQLAQYYSNNGQPEKAIDLIRFAKFAGNDLSACQYWRQMDVLNFSVPFEMPALS